MSFEDLSSFSSKCHFAQQSRKNLGDLCRRQHGAHVCEIILCPGHTFTYHLAGSTTDYISRMTPEMQISVVRYGCTIYV